MKKIKQILIKYDDGSFKGYNYNAFLAWIKQVIKIFNKEKEIELEVLK